VTLIYPGSFDPVTAGHIDIARRAVKFADRLIIAVLNNPAKQTLFSAEERVSFLKEAFSGKEFIQKSVEISSFSGLLAEFARQKNADAILRGLRTSGDFEHEHKYAAYNSALTANQTETVFLSSSPVYSFVSSTLIREAAAHIYKDDLDDSFIAGLVPTSVRAALQKIFRYYATN